MIFRTACVAGMMMAGLAACGPSGGAADAAAGDGGFQGAWKVKGHIVAPWFTGPGFAPEADKAVKDATLTLTHTSASGADWLTCDPATFETKAAAAGELFDGKVPDRTVAKSALGIDDDPAAVMVQTCGDQGKAPVTYVMAGRGRMLLAAGDVIYQFERVPDEAPAKP